MKESENLRKTREEDVKIEFFSESGEKFAEVDFTPEEYASLEAAASLLGKSVRTYILDALVERMLGGKEGGGDENGD